VVYWARHLLTGELAVGGGGGAGKAGASSCAFFPSSISSSPSQLRRTTPTECLYTTTSKSISVPPVTPSWLETPSCAHMNERCPSLWRYASLLHLCYCPKSWKVLVALITVFPNPCKHCRPNLSNFLRMQF
jgi:hypothetical protein